MLQWPAHNWSLQGLQNGNLRFQKTRSLRVSPLTPEAIKPALLRLCWICFGTYLFIAEVWSDLEEHQRLLGLLIAPTLAYFFITGITLASPRSLKELLIWALGLLCVWLLLEDEDKSLHDGIALLWFEVGLMLRVPIARWAIGSYKFDFDAPAHQMVKSKVKALFN